MKQSQLAALERLYRRRISPEEICSVEVARRLLEISDDIRRQVAILVNRLGSVEFVIVGDEKSIMIPELSDYPLGKRPLRGLRLIHTHLKGEKINNDDLTDLSLLRLDLLVAISGSAINSQLAWVSPDAGTHSPVTTDFLPLDRHNIDCSHFFDELEKNILASRTPVTGNRKFLEKGILISVDTAASQSEAEDSVAELRELARTAGVEVLEHFTQRPKAINPRFLMGEGKIRDVVIRGMQLGATMLVFDQELTPAQVRSLSELTELKVIDRSQLILDIFARRANTLDGKVQVELAQLKYLLPRLTGKGVHLSRLMGGIGGRGPGETKLEVDRRRVRDRISRLERELEALAKGRDQRRRKRVKAGVPIISIVGYTNAGKSTLLNQLTQSSVFTEDLLFATLDTSSRRLRFPMEREVIITDTVGFIRSLPKSLMGAFKATLEELEDADLLLHVVDSSHPRFQEHISEVRNILKDLKLDSKPELLVFNKSDLLEKMKKGNTISYMKIRQVARSERSVIVSAAQKASLRPLLEQLESRFWGGKADDGYR